MNNQIEIFLQDISYNTKYEFLDLGRVEHQAELEEIAKKRGIVLPANDLSIFKSTYAFTDRQNKNGCTLPKAEVASALETIVGKAIDFDHIRKRVVGYWVDAKVVGDEIVAYGIFFKGNFQEDYEMIKAMMEQGGVSISFEAWGKRDYTGTDTYNLKDIEFAGGALLIKEDPAFVGAGVLEMANKEKILEFAKVMTAPKEFMHLGTEKDIEQARFFLGDFESIVRMCMEAACPVCGGKMLDIQSIDFDGDSVGAQCAECMSKMKMNISPKPVIASIGRKLIDTTLEKINASKVTDLITFSEACNCTNDAFDNMVCDYDAGQMMECTECDYECEGETTCPKCGKPMKKMEDEDEEGKKLSYKQRKDLDDSMFALIQSVKNKGTGEMRKIRRFPINDENHVRNALARLPQAKNLTSEERDTVKSKILKRARELNMKDLLAKYDKASVEEQKKMVEELAKANEDMKAQLEKATTDLTAKVTEFDTFVKAHEEMKVKFDVASAELSKIHEEAKAKKLAERKEKLGECAKDMKDEDILDDTKFDFAVVKMEKANLEKEVAELKAKNKPENTDMTKGSKDKEKDSETFAVAKKVQEKAYPSKK